MTSCQAVRFGEIPNNCHIHTIQNACGDIYYVDKLQDKKVFGSAILVVSLSVAIMALPILTFLAIVVFVVPLASTTDDWPRSRRSNGWADRGKRDWEWIVADDDVLVVADDRGNDLLLLHRQRGEEVVDLQGMKKKSLA